MFSARRQKRLGDTVPNTPVAQATAATTDFFAGIGGDPTSSWYSLFHGSSGSDLVANVAGQNLTPNQRQNIAADCAQNRMTASGNTLTYEQALAQCVQDVNRAVPPSFNWWPYVLLGGGALLVAAVAVRR